MPKDESQRTGLENISAFGIELRRVRKEDLFLLCYWRNKLLGFMDDKRSVTPEILNFWLNRISEDNTEYPYIACINGISVGYIELKSVNLTQKNCEFGIFLFGREYMGMGIAYRMILCLELVMSKLGLNTFINRICPINIRGIRFHTKLGFKYVKKEGDFLIYSSKMICRRRKLKSIAEHLGLSREFTRYFE